MSAPLAGPATDLRLGGRYRLTGRIAGGGMGEVWTAHDEVLGREVAVKILRRELADDPTFLERFRGEARHAANLSHPNIAAVYDFGKGEDHELGSPFLVMELVPGEPLSAIVAREGALTAERTMEIVGQTARGLQAAHDGGVIHRDVKPANILVTPGGDVRITDFGIARAANSVPLTQTGTIMGTAYYISPEQASGRSVTPASDVYSLGIVAYECLTGRRPFAGDTPLGVALAQVRDEPPALPRSVPTPVRDLVMRMLAKDPAGRPSSAGELGSEALALAPAVARQQAPETRVLPVVVGPPPRHRADTDPGFRLPTPPGRRGWLPYAVGLGVVAVLVLLVARACGATDPGTVSTDAGATSAAAPSTVQVAAVDYLGRGADDVRAELEGLGLRVQVRESAGGGQVGTVKDVSPAGPVEAGGLVTVAVVAPPPGDDDDEKQKHDKRTDEPGDRGRGHDDDGEDD